MKEKTLLRMSVIFSILGILLLFYISNKIEIDSKKINEIEASDVDKSVKINGVVNNVEQRGTVSIISISQLEEMDLVVFDSIELNKGDYLEVEGKIDEYEGKMQLVADKIILK
jgi:DNA/RNA endonuclease YhcR with UshA esterase domain